MKPAPLSFAVYFVPFAFCLLLGTKLTAAQIHDQVDAVREQLVKTEEQLENSKAERARSRDRYPRPKRPCRPA